MNSLSEQIERLAVLDDPVRRKLYAYVVGRGTDVGRDEAARATRVSRSLAAFHLDKLVAAELLEATFSRLGGRTGPGAGRPSKLYRRSSTQIDVSLPQRRYELAARVLLEALAHVGPERALDALRAAAHGWGERLAAEPLLRTSRGRPMTRATRALEACGFEPAAAAHDKDELVLRNCPFDSLRNECQGLVCSMNLALVEGLLAGLAIEEVTARLCPRAGLCCVALRSGSGEQPK